MCSNCGARLEVTPETIVAICEYCGAPSVVSGVINREDIYIVPSVGEAKVLEEFWRRVSGDMDMRSIMGEIKPISVEGSYLPFWLSRATVSGNVVYEVKKYDEEGVRTVTRRESFTRTLDVELVARRQVKHVGLRELVQAYLESRPETQALAELGAEKWRSVKLPVLNLEFDRAEAEKILKEDSIDSVRSEWERRADAIRFFSAKLVSMERPRLVFLPFWTIIYEYKGSLYFAHHEGWSGKPLVFAEPMLARRRALYLLGMGFSIILGGLSGLLAAIIMGGEGKGLAFPFFLLFAAIAIGYFSSKKFISDVRVEKAWK